MKRKAKPISDRLRQAIEASGQSVYRVAKESGVDQSILQRFLAGERMPSLPNADKLAAYLGLELRPKARPRRKAR